MDDICGYDRHAVLVGKKATLGAVTRKLEERGLHNMCIAIIVCTSTYVDINVLMYAYKCLPLKVDDRCGHSRHYAVPVG